MFLAVSFSIIKTEESCFIHKIDNICHQKPAISNFFPTVVSGVIFHKLCIFLIFVTQGIDLLGCEIMSLRDKL